MSDKPSMNDGVTMTTTVEAFTATSSDGGMVVVRQEELGTKFKRGEIAPNESGDTYVSMILKVDGEHIDLVLIDGGSYLIESLRQIREAAEIALDGLRKRPRP